nr:dual specificity protein phosphatase MPK-4-like [Onthophagus taurus]XP_022908639.1 dual specificity protein phosphatase MPK-4-like [Onthophagus taurus]
MEKSVPKGDVLHTYFNGGPVSIDLIEKNLYLGSLSAATDIPTLNKYEITHILTIDTVPLPRNVLDIRNITSKFIQLSDQPKEDLLSHFTNSIEFINNGISKGNVLVHCYFGVSRSATIIIAYIMKKYNLNYTEALKKVKKRRSIVCPNRGFVTQLILFEEMLYKVNPNHLRYKNYRLTCAADKVKKAKILPQDYHDLIKRDPGVTQIQPEPNVYRCKRCRRVLAGESNLITHKEKISDEKICRKTYFLEPLSWMNGITQSVQGKLHCPKCNNKVGSFSWVMGCACPCGCEVAPAFYLTPSKIDWTNVVKNVEITL